jgi:flagellar basal body-associated protein FliL
MKYTYGLSDKIIAYLTLISGLVISAVAVWYSVAGLVSIFAASAMSIIIMGVALETSKLVATVWLKWNWKRAPRLIKIYLISAIIILMVITSMGIFGYLSRAHLDQNIISGDVQSRIALVDEKISIERENIANAQSLIKQMDAAVTGVIATGDREITLRDGSTRIQSAAERSLQIRRSQAKDRAALTQQIEESQDRIVKLQEEIAPVRAEMRKVEAEVGPIKYIAKLIYGDKTDQNMLEKAVTWVIIIIVLVFDPLAVVLLLSSQYSFQWFRQQDEERKNELVQKTTPPEDAGKETPPASEPVVGTVDEGSGGQPQPDPEPQTGDDVAEEANRKIAEIEPEELEPVIPEEPQQTEKDPLTEWNEMIAEAERAAEAEREPDDHEILEQAHAEEKIAMQAWKAENPDSSLKIQRRLYARGKIDKLPWMEYLKAEADFLEDDAAIEAAKWAQEQIDAKKKDIDLDGNDRRETSQEIQRLKGYIQNQEQNDLTLWQRIQKSKNE